MTHSAQAPNADGGDFGAQLRRLLAERGMSLHRLAKTVNYDVGYLCKVKNGRKRASAEMAARIDQALGADGALVACVPEPKSAARSAERRKPRSGEREPGRADRPGLASLPGHPDRPANAGGISLTLPCAPMRLVIEISGIGENAEMVGAVAELAGGQGALMLVRDRAPGGGKR